MIERRRGRRWEVEDSKAKDKSIVDCCDLCE